MCPKGSGWGEPRTQRWANGEHGSPISLLPALPGAGRSRRYRRIGAGAWLDGTHRWTSIFRTSGILEVPKPGQREGGAAGRARLWRREMVGSVRRARMSFQKLGSV
jgi:hypothetical protein